MRELTVTQAKSVHGGCGVETAVIVGVIGCVTAGIVLTTTVVKALMSYRSGNGTTTRTAS